jgi:hypothetical protein
MQKPLACCCASSMISVAKRIDGTAIDDEQMLCAGRRLTEAFVNLPIYGKETLTGSAYTVIANIWLCLD